MTNYGKTVSGFVLLILVGIGFLIFKTINDSTRLPIVASFEECATAGYPVMESYPRQCRTATGELFVEKIAEATPPITTPPVDTTVGYVSGHVTIGPNCPGPEKADDPCVTRPEVYTSREAIVYKRDAITVVTKIHLDAQGNYKIALVPDNYFIKIEPAGFRLSKLQNITIKASETTTANFDIDTGIR